MNELKFLLRRAFGKWHIWVVSILLGGIMLFLSIIEPAELGDTDYIVSRFMGSSMAIILFSMGIGIFLAADLTGNRLMRSAPFAKRLITVTVPAFFSTLGTILALISCAIYGIFTEVSDLSDFVILAAVSVFACTICATIAVNIRYGMILLIYSYFPLFGLVMLLPRSLKQFGFGLPLGAAFGILAASAVISFFAGMAISILFFKKANFKAYVTTAEMIQR